MFRILVVEDDTELRKLFCTVLRDNSFIPIEAGNGEEALDILDKEYIDLIISDIMMPKMDGYEMTKQLRQAGIDIPILMITAKDGIFYKREGFSSGTDDYMVKPVDVNEMIWRVQALLRRSQSIHDHRLTIGGTTLESDSYTSLRLRRTTHLQECRSWTKYGDLTRNPLSIPLKYTSADSENI